MRINKIIKKEEQILQGKTHLIVLFAVNSGLVKNNGALNEMLFLILN